MNSFGRLFNFTTFGESHGSAIGAVVSGFPSMVKLDLDFIQSELDRRRPGRNSFSTQRKEGDVVEILSGVFEGFITGSPISLIVYNTNQLSKDYENIKDIFRPGHADFTYQAKYGVRDYRGGGRSSARESVARVAVGAIAKHLLGEIGIIVESGVLQIGDIKSQNINFDFAKGSDIYSLDKDIETFQKDLIERVKSEHDSIGGVVLVRAKNIPIGLGEPLYYKLDAILADAMIGINGVKGVEIGEGVNCSKLKGSQNNDCMDKGGFLSNHNGGILGGISNGEDIEIKGHFKPTPSIFLPQSTIDKNGKEVICELKGRHDPYIAIRGSIVAEAMCSIVLADMILLNLSSNIKNILKVYK